MSAELYRNLFLINLIMIIGFQLLRPSDATCVEQEVTQFSVPTTSETVSVVWGDALCKTQSRLTEYIKRRSVLSLNIAKCSIL